MAFTQICSQTLTVTLLKKKIKVDKSERKQDETLLYTGG